LRQGTEPCGLRVNAHETGVKRARNLLPLQTSGTAAPGCPRKEAFVPKIDTGDTAWMLASAALVMFMTPGLALFYGGLVRAKNVLGTIMQSFIALGLITILWALFGYSLAFGPDAGRLIGNLSLAGLHGVGAIPSAYAPTVPATTFMVFQLMFAIITPALIAGAFADRMKFSGYLLF